MAVGGVPLIVLKNFFYHCICLGSEPRYFALKARAMRAAARLGAYEAADIKRLPVLIRPGSDVVDVGANFGAYTLIMARLVGPTGKVFAFEPIPALADALTRTCEAFPNVKVLGEALSGGHGEREVMDLRVPLLAGGVPEPALAAVDPAPWAGTGLRTWKVFRVPARRLDDHLASFRDVSFIKVDVEGHEPAFLEGAIETIRRFRPVLQLEWSGLRAHAAAVEGWTRDARYVLLTVTAGRVDLAAPDRSSALNVYGVPEEMVARLGGALLQKPGPA
jgi:FkbM family methyltransferase